MKVTMPMNVSDCSSSGQFSGSPKAESLLAQLRSQMEQIETAHRVDDETVVKNGCKTMDDLLPEKGYRRGSLVQWISRRGEGASWLALQVAKNACSDGGALVVIDPDRQFNPVAAASLGIDLMRVVVLHNERGATESSCQSGMRSGQELLWAVDQALRCPAVAAVWGPLKELDERWFRRFQLSAESSGAIGLLLQPPRAARVPSWADVQWIVGQGVPPKSGGCSPSVSCSPSESCSPQGGARGASDAGSRPAGSVQSVRLLLAHCRRGRCGQSVDVVIDHVTGKVV